MAGNALTAGLSLRIPDVSRATNSASTYRTYQPSEIIGSTTPQGIDPGPPPPPKDDCGAFKQFLVIVVAVAVTAYLGPAATNWLASTGGAFTTGAVTAAGAAVPSAAAYAVGGAAAAAAGSVASQTVGMAVGLQDSFSWKAVGMAALGGAISGGMQGLGAESKAFATWMKQNPALSAMAANAMTQGIGVMTGLQEKFSWQSVAVSGASAWINSQIPNGTPGANGTLQPLSAPEKLVRNFLTGTTTQIIRMAVYGQGKLDFASIAADAFGNAIGESVAESMKPDERYSLAGGRLGENGGRSAARFSDPGDSSMPTSLTFAQDSAMRRAANDPMGLLIAASDAASTARQVQALWGAPTGREPSGYLSDSATNAEVTAELMRQAGYEGEMIPTAGSVNVIRGGGGRPAMVNGISVNRRAEAAFQAADDLLGMASMYRDYKLLGALMSEAQQTATLNKLTSALQGKLGMMRVLPTPVFP